MGPDAHSRGNTQGNRIPPVDFGGFDPSPSKWSIPVYVYGQRGRTIRWGRIIGLVGFRILYTACTFPLDVSSISTEGKSSFPKFRCSRHRSWLWCSCPYHALISLTGPSGRIFRNISKINTDADKTRKKKSSRMERLQSAQTRDKAIPRDVGSKPRRPMRLQSRGSSLCGAPVPPYAPAISASLATVFMLRAVPRAALGILRRVVPMPSG